MRFIALTIALSVLDSTEVAIPAAVYSILMYVLATAFGFAITAGRRRQGTDGWAPRPVRPRPDRDSGTTG